MNPPTECKLCKKELTKKDNFAAQGICMECADGFSRYNPKFVSAPATGKKTAEAPEEKKKFVPKKRCTRCGDFGHATDECRTKLCTFCDGRGHTSEHCYSDPKNCCEKCGLFGHKQEECVTCERCGDSGHSTDECRTKICDNCGKRGHLDASCWHNMTCDRCGLKGHVTDSCRTKLWCDKCKQPHKKCNSD